ncbi:MAG: hypothetical protein P0S95_03340 [Rhabdochlamydiaceae bacterium]|nr:hypothetical protein [Candidatus Amphrikana amoebophyrae]
MTLSPIYSLKPTPKVDYDHGSTVANAQKVADQLNIEIQTIYNAHAKKEYLTYNQKYKDVNMDLTPCLTLQGMKLCSQAIKISCDLDIRVINITTLARFIQSDLPMKTLGMVIYSKQARHVTPIYVRYQEKTRQHQFISLDSLGVHDEIIKIFQSCSFKHAVTICYSIGKWQASLLGCRILSFCALQSTHQFFLRKPKHKLNLKLSSKVANQVEFVIETFNIPSSMIPFAQSRKSMDTSYDTDLLSSKESVTLYRKRHRKIIQTIATLKSRGRILHTKNIEHIMCTASKFVETNLLIKVKQQYLLEQDKEKKNCLVFLSLLISLITVFVINKINKDDN